MAWWNGGTWLGQPVSELAKKASCELINAVNERIDVLREMPGRSTDGTYYSGGASHWHSGDFPSYADLEDQYLKWWDRYCYANLQDSIESIYPFFLKVHTVSPPVATPYSSLADLLGEGSYGSSWVVAPRPGTTDAFLQMKEALENLTWPLGAVTSYVSGSNLIHYQSSPVELTAALAWASSRGKALWGASGHHHQMDVYKTPASGTINYWAVCGKSGDVTITFPDSWPALDSPRIFYGIRYAMASGDTAEGFVADATGTITDNWGGSITTSSWADEPGNYVTQVRTSFPTGTTHLILTFYPTLHPWTTIPVPTVGGTHKIGNLFWEVYANVGAGGNIVDYRPHGDLTSLMTYG